MGSPCLLQEGVLTDPHAALGDITMHCPPVFSDGGFCWVPQSCHSCPEAFTWAVLSAWNAVPHNLLINLLICLRSFLEVTFPRRPLLATLFQIASSLLPPGIPRLLLLTFPTALTSL